MNDVLDKLKKEVEEDVTVMASATTLIDGIADRVQSAVAKALANGATAEQLAPVTDEIAMLAKGKSDLSAAVVKNTTSATSEPAPSE